MAKIVTRESRLRVRSGPGPNYAVVGYRNNGDTVVVAERSGEWVRIAPGQWVHGDYVREAAGSPDPDTVGAVVDHPEHPGDPHWKVLIGFESNRSDLRRKHMEWLGSYVCSQVRAGQYVYVRGMASRLGDAGHNRRISEARAMAVRDYLRSECGVPASRITGVTGVGELRARGSETDDDPRSRAVEVIVTNRTIALEGMQLSGRRPISSTFHIKYLGSTSASLALDVDIALFVIRSDQDYWQLYQYEGGGGGLSAPAGWGEGAPRGEGWVEFTTSKPMSVSDFAGAASVGQVGLQAHSVGGSLIQLDTFDIGSVTMPTGPGVSIGLSRTVGALTRVGDVQFDEDGLQGRSSSWRRF